MDLQPGGADVETRPRLVDWGVLAALAAAVVNLLIAVELVVGAVTTRVAVVPALVAVVVAITVLYAAAVAVLALLLRAGRPRARGALLGVSALSLLTLLAPNAPNLVVTALLIVADVLLYRRPVSDWVRALIARRA